MNEVYHLQCSGFFLNPNWSARPSSVLQSSLLGRIFVRIFDAHGIKLIVPKFLHLSTPTLYWYNYYYTFLENFWYFVLFRTSLLSLNRLFVCSSSASFQITARLLSTPGVLMFVSSFSAISSSDSKIGSPRLSSSMTVSSSAIFSN